MRLPMDPVNPQSVGGSEVGGTQREVLTHIVHSTRDAPALAGNEARRVFNSLPFLTGKLQENHSHGLCALNRGAASDFARRYAEKLNLKLYSVQHSQRDVDSGTAGERTYYWDKDCDKAPQRRHGKDGVRAYIDVDFHMPDMPQRLLGSRHPVILYTENPVSAAGHGEYSHWFQKNGVYSTRVNGGGEFHQQLWDYTHDCIRVVNRTFGIVTHMTSFLVDRRQITDTKCLVLLTPISTWWGLAATIAECSVAGHELKRFNPVSDGWAKLYVQTSEGIKVSVAQASSMPTVSVTVGLEDFEAARLCDQLAKQDASVASNYAWANNNRGEAAILANFLRHENGMKGAYVTDVRNSICHYTADILNHDTGDYKSGIVAFMTPVVKGGSFDPVKDDMNGRWAVKDRITQFQTGVPLRFGPGRVKFIRDFVEQLASDIGKVTPQSVDDVWDKQSRATQRQIISAAVNQGGTDTDDIRAFVKKESYSKPGAPRVISTIPGLTKVEYSRYIYAITAEMKKFPWYGFGKPAEIAQKVANLAEDQSVLIETDYSRMDGHVKAELREFIEEPLMKLLFPDDEYVLELMKKQYGQRGKLGQIEYKTGYARASGSPETSLFNTIDSACISYVHLRTTGKSHGEALDHLGLYAGDDALECPVEDPVKECRRRKNNAKSFGQTLKTNIVRAPYPPQFLARYFGEAWYGGLNSMCDVGRQLAKFHTCTHMPPGITAKDKAVAKAKAYLLTDANTPIIGALCKSIIADLGTETKVNRPMNWWSTFEEDQFPNEHAQWMEDLVDESFPDFDRRAFAIWCTQNVPLTPPTCAEVSPKHGSVPLIINGELQDPVET